MTKEQRVQSMAMMENMKKIQAQGGSMKDVMDQLAKNQPKGDKGAAPPDHRIQSSSRTA